MKTGELNRVITISTKSETESSADVTEVWSTPVSVRAKVTQVDGSRYSVDSELIDRALYKIECWDNNYSDNIRIVYDSLTLYPIRPITRKYENSSLKECSILAAVKK